MKKTKKQKRFESKHWSMSHLSAPYMVLKYKSTRGKRSTRFKMDKFKKNVESIIKRHSIPLFSGRCYTMKNGIGIQFPEKVINILTSVN